MLIKNILKGFLGLFFVLLNSAIFSQENNAFILHVLPIKINSNNVCFKDYAYTRYNNSSIKAKSTPSNGFEIGLNYEKVLPNKKITVSFGATYIYEKLGFIGYFHPIDYNLFYDTTSENNAVKIRNWKKSYISTNIGIQYKYKQWKFGVALRPIIPIKNKQYMELPNSQYDTLSIPIYGGVRYFNRLKETFYENNYLKPSFWIELNTQYQLSNSFSLLASINTSLNNRTNYQLIYESNVRTKNTELEVLNDWRFTSQRLVANLGISYLIYRRK